MATPQGVRSSFFNRLLLPFSIYAGSQFYPRRTYKRMKVFTLTSPANYDDITLLKENNLTSNEFIRAWTSGLWNRSRLETACPIRVVGHTRFENHMSAQNSATTCRFLNEFPFDIINIDFISQYPDSGSGYIENEINALENTIKIQKQQEMNNSFVLMYSTIPSSQNINCALLKTNCDSIHCDNWIPLNIAGYANSVSTIQDKLELIHDALTHLVRKYDLSIIRDFEHHHLVIGDNHFFSFVGIFRG